MKWLYGTESKWGGPEKNIHFQIIQVTFLQHIKMPYIVIHLFIFWYMYWMCKTMQIVCAVSTVYKTEIPDNLAHKIILLVRIEETIP